MTNEEAMKKALAELESSSKPNYTEIAQKRDFFSSQRQCLSDIQEELLIDQINRLTDRGIPPTSQIVKNFVEEIIRRALARAIEKYNLTVENIYN